MARATTAPLLLLGQLIRPPASLILVPPLYYQYQVVIRNVLRKLGYAFFLPGVQGGVC